MVFGITHRCLFTSMPTNHKFIIQIKRSCGKQQRYLTEYLCGPYQLMQRVRQGNPHHRIDKIICAIDNTRLCYHVLLSLRHSMDNTLHYF